MKQLNNTQILYIENDLKSKGLKEDSLKYEIIDHMCCLVEKKLNEGKDFSTAYEASLKSFKDEGFKNLQLQVNKNLPSNSLINSKILISGIAACILMFVVVVDARDRPDIRPLDQKYEITSNFGNRFEPIQKVRKFHTGIDIKAPKGTPVKATAEGVVIVAKSSEGYGIHVIIRHDDQYETMYAHLSQVDIKSGEKVLKGQQIGLSGNTGRSTAPHLHYEVRKNGKNVDPANYFQPE